MKKRLVSLICIAALAASIIPSVVSGASSNDVLKAVAPPVIDGKNDDFWDQAIAYPMPNYLVAVHDHDGDHGAPRLDPVKEADDFSGAWKALWDDQNFYLLIEITDQKRIGWNIEAERNEIHYDDIASFYLTPDKNTPYTTALWHPKSNDMKGWHGPPDWKNYDLSKIEWSVNDHDTGYIIEAAIPWSVAGTQPKANQRLLFDAQAVDNDLGGDWNASNGVNGRYPQSKITWSDLKNKAWEDNANLGTIVLRDATTASPAAGSGITLYINGDDKTAEAAPVIVNDRTLVPLRMIFQTLGAEVEWDQETKSVHAKKDKTSISLQIGSKKATKNGSPLELDVEPQLINDKTMVPLRFVSEALGAEVKWVEETKSIYITSKK
ncbi:stalk domain-containing protein [Paenibacillus tarimensis]